ncbi:MAG: tripartite tricarboxylate transporter substrate binding protein [Deltaproteobacteria bacterium]|nr:tripartite tricarboxylate transporter substrate binding protein [Deltaproteobacteria bacterium]
MRSGKHVGMLLGLLAWSGIFLHGQDVWAQGFKPSGPIEVVVHSKAGGGSDLFARAIADMTREENIIPHRMQVTNKSGGSGAVAMTYLVGKKGDTHTIGFFTPVLIVTPLTLKEAQVTIQDLTPIARLALEPTVAVVKADAPYKTMRDFVEAAKKNPGKLKQPGGAISSLDNLFRMLIQKATGAQWAYINLESGGERVANLLGGHMDLMLDNPDKSHEYVRAGSMRVIAALTENRLSLYPDVPTIKEQGIDIPILTQSRGVMAPPGTSKEVVAYWEGVFERLNKTPRWKKYLADNLMEDGFLRSQELGKFWDTETRLLRDVLKEAGVKVVR